MVLTFWMKLASSLVQEVVLVQVAVEWGQKPAVSFVVYATHV